MQKTVNTAIAAKIDKKLTLEHHFSNKLHFWSILESQEGSKNGPKGMGRIDKNHFFTQSDTILHLSAHALRFSFDF